MDIGTRFKHIQEYHHEIDSQGETAGQKENCNSKRWFKRRQKGYQNVDSQQRTAEERKSGIGIKKEKEIPTSADGKAKGCCH